MGSMFRIAAAVIVSLALIVLAVAFIAWRVNTDCAEAQKFNQAVEVCVADDSDKCQVAPRDFVDYEENYKYLKRVCQ